MGGYVGRRSFIYASNTGKLGLDPGPDARDVASLEKRVEFLAFLRAGAPCNVRY